MAAASASGSESESDMTAGLDGTAKLRSLHLSRRRARSRPPARAAARPSPGSIFRPASIRTPIPCPISSPRRGRGCPRAARSQSSRPPRRRRYGAGAASVVAGPGSQALIHALVPHPAARRGRRAGADLRRLRSRLRRRWRARGRSRAARGHGRASTSRSWSIPTIRTGGSFRAPLSSRCMSALARRGGVLIVDEAFADFDGRGKPRADAARERRGRAALVRQDLRTGRPSSRLRARFAGHRPVLAGGAGAVAGQRAGDRDRGSRARRFGLARSDARAPRQGRGAARRAPARARAGESSAERACFDWPAHDDARAAFERLLAAGILARPFADAPDRLRFGIPGDENAWERLATALRG